MERAGPGTAQRGTGAWRRSRVAGGLRGFLSQKSFSAVQEGSSSLAGLRRSSANLLFQVHAVKNTINMDVLGACCVLIAKQN